MKKGHSAKPGNLIKQRTAKVGQIGDGQKPQFKKGRSVKPGALIKQRTAMPGLEVINSERGTLTPSPKIQTQPSNSGKDESTSGGKEKKDSTEKNEGGEKERVLSKRRARLQYEPSSMGLTILGNSTKTGFALCCSICVSDAIDGNDIALIRDTVVDFGGDVVSMSSFLSASHSFVVTTVFIEGALPKRQTGGNGRVTQKDIANNFSAFMEHLLHDEHFSGNQSPIKSVGASAGQICISTKPSHSSSFLATGEVRGSEERRMAGAKRQQKQHTT